MSFPLKSPAIRRGAIAVLLASALLHLLLLNWADESMADFKTALKADRLIEVELRPIKPKLPPAEPASKPQPRAAKPARPRPAPRPPAPAPAQAVPALASAPAITAPTGDAGAKGAAAAAPAPATGPTFRVSPPPSARLQYRVVRQEPRLDNPYFGSGTIVWRTGGGKYALDMNVSIIVNVFSMSSEGDINEAGIAPRKVTERRRGRSETATHFNREQGTITFSASTASVPLTEGAQDQATIAMQLAGIGRADPGQFSPNREFDILVGESREATVFRFVVTGQVELETELGKFAAWHIVRPPRPGTYSSRLDFWFAPALDWYPVQIRNSEANGAVTTQTAVEILTAGSDGSAQ